MSKRTLWLIATLIWLFGGGPVCLWLAITLLETFQRSGGLAGMIGLSGAVAICIGWLYVLTGVCLHQGNMNMTEAECREMEERLRARGL